MPIVDIVCVGDRLSLLSAGAVFWIGAVAIVVPVTSRERHLPTHIRIPARQETGVSNESWAKADDVKSVSVRRLEEHLGEIDPTALSRLEEALRLILEI